METLGFILVITIVWLVIFALKHESDIHNNYTEFLKDKEIREKRDKLIDTVKKRKINKAQETTIAEPRNKIQKK
jgi:hypothetical protein